MADTNMAAGGSDNLSTPASSDSPALAAAATSSGSADPAEKPSADTGKVPSTLTGVRPPTPPRSAGGQRGPDGGTHSPAPGKPQVPACPVTTSSLSDDLRTVQASLNRYSNKGPVGATYQAERVLGSGAFGIVYQARITETGEIVAIKKVLQDSRFKNRELEMMQDLKHVNIVELKSAFHVPGDKPKENYLNVVMEYCSETMMNIMSQYLKMRKPFPYELVQLYTYHMLRGVAYLMTRNICHRDIKPPNLLVNEDRHELKICDFGSAKRLSKGEPNVAYICSRYYRAPELIFGATDYSTLIDMWSVACVTAEMILQQVLFPGDSGVDQLMEIIKVLGTPTLDDLNSMNPVYGEFKFPQIKSYPWSKIFRTRTKPEAVDWLSKVLQYDPNKRPGGMQAIMHKFFDDVRHQYFKTSRPLSMFWFSDEELNLMNEDMRKTLIPEWVRSEVGTQGGPVPKDLDLIPKAKVHELSAIASACSSTHSSFLIVQDGDDASSADRASPSGEKKERRRRRRDRDKDEEGKKEDGAEKDGAEDKDKEKKDRRRRSDDPEGESGLLQAPGDGSPDGRRRKPSDERGERRHRSDREDGEVKRAKSPRGDDEEGKSRRKNRKASSEEQVEDGGSSSSREKREKRKGRERGEKRHDTIPEDGEGIMTGSLSAREGGSSASTALPQGSQSAREPRSKEGDPLAEFAHAMQALGGTASPAAQAILSLACEQQVQARLSSEARSGDSPARPKSSGGAGGDKPALPSGLQGLASAGAMQLVPAAATLPKR